MIPVRALRTHPDASRKRALARGNVAQHRCKGRTPAWTKIVPRGPKSPVASRSACPRNPQALLMLRSEVSRRGFVGGMRHVAVIANRRGLGSMRISSKSVRTIVAGVLLSQGATALAQDVDFQ